jgi:hypothetical protein
VKRIVLLLTVAAVMASMASPAWAVVLKAADWQMNDPVYGQMLDSSGNNNNGTPKDVIQTGAHYDFNGSTSHVLVPDADSLDPQANDITLTASVWVNGLSLNDESYDVVRKGLVTTTGGDYKMEIQRTDATVGKLHCLFRGNRRTVDTVAQRDIVDGNWHTLQCIKKSTSVVAMVDGSSFTKTGKAGSIANASAVMVGAKEVTPKPDDMFNGSMDFVSIDIGQ